MTTNDFPFSSHPKRATAAPFTAQPRSAAVGRECQHFPPSLPPRAAQNSTVKSHSKQKLNGPGVNTI